MLKNTWLRATLAIITGEIALVLLTTLAQEVLFDGIRFRTSPWGVLLLGGFATFLAAVGAGFLARRVSRTPWIVVPVVISLIILTETSYLIVQEISGDPVWFDVLAGLSLVVGVWLGYYGITQSRWPAKVPS